MREISIDFVQIEKYAFKNLLDRTVEIYNHRYEVIASLPPLNCKNIVQFEPQLILGFSMGAHGIPIHHYINESISYFPSQPNLFYIIPEEWVPHFGSRKDFLTVKKDSNSRDQLIIY